VELVTLVAMNIFRDYVNLIVGIDVEPSLTWGSEA